MKKINNKNYSKTEFDTYEIWVKLEIIHVDGSNHLVDLYTEETDLDVIKEAMKELMTDKVGSFKIINHNTKEGCIRISEFITESLKDWE